MKQYEVTGMSCAACSARVEKAVSKVPGVTSCSVSLLTNSMGVEGTATDQEIVNAVVAAGYGAAPKGAKKEQTAAEEEEALKDHETPKLRKRLIASVIFLVVLMYFSMGHMMWRRGSGYRAMKAATDFSSTQGSVSREGTGIPL